MGLIQLVQVTVVSGGTVNRDVISKIQKIKVTSFPILSLANSVDAKIM